ncbi:molecular chaperone HtpG [Vigna unguiculata]|uniref:Molecular chaperone HtpG n=1 Tax=Vigna unguiculata TaxID=3917 RepID=A0A4D6LWI8_VIGUN|nr:molecular chaperone HtpG [Vigna unguiculata]
MANDKILVLEGEKSEMLSLVKNTFYSNKGIFLRELIINASNALDEIQFERLTKKNCLNNELIVRLIIHKVNKTLSIIDNGIGMTKAERTAIVYLWNPSTNECKVTPPSPVEDIPYYFDIVIEYEGFGYDIARDDYKVIREVCYYEEGNLVEINHNEWQYDRFWEIYSLRSNSWRKLNIEFLNCQGINNRFYLDGMCHWLCNNGDEGYLVSFDISNEVCYTTLTPLDIPTKTYNDFNLCLVMRHLFLLNGSIALISSYKDTTIFYISILVEVGKKETWTKLFTIGPLPSLSFPIGTSNMGNILFQTNDGELAWFDLRTNLIEKLGVNVHKRTSHPYLLMLHYMKQNLYHLTLQWFALVTYYNSRVTCIKLNYQNKKKVEMHQKSKEDNQYFPLHLQEQKPHAYQDEKRKAYPQQNEMCIRDRLGFAFLIKQRRRKKGYFNLGNSRKLERVAFGSVCRRSRNRHPDSGRHRTPYGRHEPVRPPLLTPERSHRDALSPENTVIVAAPMVRDCIVFSLVPQPPPRRDSTRMDNNHRVYRLQPPSLLRLDSPPHRPAASICHRSTSRRNHHLFFLLTFALLLRLQGDEHNRKSAREFDRHRSAPVRTRLDTTTLSPNPNWPNNEEIVWRQFTTNQTNSGNFPESQTLKMEYTNHT